VELAGQFRREVAPADHERFGVVSPSTEEVVGEVPLATTADIDRAVGAARSAFDDGPWPRMTPGDRADVLARAATILRKREAEIAGVTVDEMGCAISQAPRAQTGMVAALFDYYAGGWLATKLFHVVTLHGFFNLSTWLTAIAGAAILLLAYHLVTSRSAGSGRSRSGRSRSRRWAHR